MIFAIIVFLAIVLVYCIVLLFASSSLNLHIISVLLDAHSSLTLDEINKLVSTKKIKFVKRLYGYAPFLNQLQIPTNSKEFIKMYLDNLVNSKELIFACNCWTINHDGLLTKIIVESKNKK